MLTRLLALLILGEVFVAVSRFATGGHRQDPYGRADAAIEVVGRPMTTDVQILSNGQPLVAFPALKIDRFDAASNSLLLFDEHSLYVWKSSMSRPVKLATIPPSFRIMAADATADRGTIVAYTHDEDLLVKRVGDSRMKVLLRGAGLVKKIHHKFPSSMLSRIAISPDGFQVAISAPSDTLLDDPSGEPMLESYLVSLKSGAISRLGWGNPIGWLDQNHLATTGLDLRNKRTRHSLWIYNTRTRKVERDWVPKTGATVPTAAVSGGFLYLQHFDKASKDTWVSAHRGPDWSASLGRTDLGKSHNTSPFAVLASAR